MNGPSQRWKGSWMISRSANSSSKKGWTSSRVAGPPRVSMTMPVGGPPTGPTEGSRPGGEKVLSSVMSKDKPPGLPSYDANAKREAGELGDGPELKLLHQAFAVG